MLSEMRRASISIDNRLPMAFQSSRVFLLQIPAVDPFAVESRHIASGPMATTRRWTAAIDHNRWS